MEIKPPNGSSGAKSSPRKKAGNSSWSKENPPIKCSCKCHPKLTQKNVSLIQESPSKFVSRKAYVDEIHRKLINLERNHRKPLERLHILSGLGGSGKSEIVREYVQRYVNYHQHVFFIRATSKDTTITQFQNLVKVLQEYVPEATFSDLREIKNEEDKISKFIQEVYDAFSTHFTKGLFIFEDVPRLKDKVLGEGQEELGVWWDLEKFLPKASLQNMPLFLLTSRNGPSAWGERETKPVGLFVPDETLQFISKKSRIYDKHNQDELNETKFSEEISSSEKFGGIKFLVEASGGWPLGLELIMEEVNAEVKRRSEPKKNSILEVRKIPGHAQKIPAESPEVPAEGQKMPAENQTSPGKETEKIPPGDIVKDIFESMDYSQKILKQSRFESVLEEILHTCLTSMKANHPEDSKDAWNLLKFMAFLPPNKILLGDLDKFLKDPKNMELFQNRAIFQQCDGKTQRVIPILEDCSLVTWIKGPVETGDTLKIPGFIQKFLRERQFRKSNWRTLEQMLEFDSINQDVFDLVCSPWVQKNLEKGEGYCQRVCVLYLSFHVGETLHFPRREDLFIPQDWSRISRSLVEMRLCHEDVDGSWPWNFLGRSADDLEDDLSNSILVWNKFPSNFGLAVTTFAVLEALFEKNPGFSFLKDPANLNSICDNMKEVGNSLEDSSSENLDVLEKFTYQCIQFLQLSHERNGRNLKEDRLGSVISNFMSVAGRKLTGPSVPGLWELISQIIDVTGETFAKAFCVDKTLAMIGRHLGGISDDSQAMHLMSFSESTQLPISPELVVVLADCIKKLAFLRNEGEVLLKSVMLMAGLRKGIRACAENLDNHHYPQNRSSYNKAYSKLHLALLHVMTSGSKVKNIESWFKECNDLLDNAKINYFRKLTRIDVLMLTATLAKYPQTPGGKLAERILSKSHPSSVQKFLKPPCPTKTFVGQQHHLSKLRRILTWPPNYLRLHGVEGSGKSELAKMYCAKYDNKYDAIFWIDFAAPLHTKQELIKLLHIMDYRQSITSRRESLIAFEFRNLCKLLIHHIRNYMGQVLFVLDNIDENKIDSADYNFVVASVGNTSFSRNNNKPHLLTMSKTNHSGEQAHYLGDLDANDGEKLLQKLEVTILQDVKENLPQLNRNFWGCFRFFHKWRSSPSQDVSPTFLQKNVLCNPLIICLLAHITTRKNPQEVTKLLEEMNEKPKEIRNFLLQHFTGPQMERAEFIIESFSPKVRQELRELDGKRKNDIAEDIHILETLGTISVASEPNSDGVSHKYLAKQYEVFSPEDFVKNVFATVRQETSGGMKFVWSLFPHVNSALDSLTGLTDYGNMALERRMFLIRQFWFLELQFPNYGQEIEHLKKRVTALDVFVFKVAKWALDENSFLLIFSVHLTAKILTWNSRTRTELMAQNVGFYKSPPEETVERLGFKILIKMLHQNSKAPPGIPELFLDWLKNMRHGVYESTNKFLTVYMDVHRLWAGGRKDVQLLADLYLTYPKCVQRTNYKMYWQGIGQLTETQIAQFGKHFFTGEGIEILTQFLKFSPEEVLLEKKIMQNEEELEQLHSCLQILRRWTRDLNTRILLCQSPDFQLSLKKLYTFSQHVMDPTATTFESIRSRDAEVSLENEQNTTPMTTPTRGSSRFLKEKLRQSLKLVENIYSLINGGNNLELLTDV